MKYIIVDLEATCWDGKGHGNKNEIIEIGALCINEHKETESEFSAFIKPILNPELSEFCIGLTSIQQSDVDKAETFDKVIKRFKEWINIEEPYLLCSWGMYDKNQFASDCLLHKLNTDWLKYHISLKHQYTDIKQLKRHTGMSGALYMEHLKLEGTHHRGIDDARNIAKIFVKCFDEWEFE